MKTIRANCATCHDITLTDDAVTVRECLTDRTFTCVFRCPHCAGPRAQTISVRIAEVLIGFGVRVVRWRWPLELSEPRPVGPAIDADDVIDFYLACEQVDDLAALALSGRTSR